MAAEERIGLVLAGGGARGAYEAGALSVLLPELERRGQRPTVILGTSAGAINAAFLASTAHLPAAQAADLALQRWAEIDWERVLRPIAGQGTALSGARYAGAVLGVPRVRLTGLLDPSPLRETLLSWIDWGQLGRNADSDALDAVAVVATAALSARSVVFVAGTPANAIEPSHEIDYVGAEIGPDHVRASAAIPLAFPAVHLDSPSAAEGWYFDGGTRLNTPIKPAIDLGIDRVVIVASHAVNPPTDSNWHVPGSSPDFGDALIQLMFAALVDPLVADVRMLGKINLLLSGGKRPEEAGSGRRLAERNPYRRIPYVFIAPGARDRIGDLAARTYAEHHAGVRGMATHPSIAILARLLGGVTEPHGELLSYLLFTPEFAEALIAQGERDAREWLQREWGTDGPWMVEPIDALDMS